MSTPPHLTSDRSPDRSGPAVSAPATPPRTRLRRFVREVTCPHGIHPALVPGVSIEDQRVRYGVDRAILVVVGALVMGFAAGIGIGIIFFGPYEPLTFYLSPRPGSADPASTDAITGALAQSALHWGINAWAIHAVVGLAVAYVSYRRGRVPLMSSILMPLFGRGDRTDSFGARLIDSLAIIATLFGTAASLGIVALQIGRGVEPVPTGSRYAVGGDFDSTSFEVTDWYCRTDEDGNPVAYDYDTGEYLEEDGRRR